MLNGVPQYNVGDKIRLKLLYKYKYKYISTLANLKLISKTKP